MSGEQVTINQVIVRLLEGATRGIRRAMEGATDEQLHYRPSTDANSIAWLVWHLSRWRDYMTASISGDQQVWLAAGWADRFALPPDLPNQATGWGDSSEQVAVFRADREVLLGYVEAVHRAAIERIVGLTPEQLEQPVLWGTPETPVDRRPVWQALVSLCNDSLQHTGQVNYIRGLVSEPDWRR